jgi:hypothetical protein
VNAKDWFFSGWGRWGLGGALPRLQRGAPVLCLGGPLHGKHLPYDAPHMRAPIPRPASIYWEDDQGIGLPEIVTYVRRRWLGNVMAVPLELYVLDRMTDAAARMHLGELGYSFGGLR